MRSTLAALTVITGFGIFHSRTSLGADWPQWRGPQRNGISQETRLLKQWPDGGPKMLWQIKNLGGGFSTPSIVGDRLFVQTNSGNDAESVKCLSTVDGKEIWAVQIGKVGNPNQRPNYPAARATPTVEGDVLYALGSDGDLVCLETASGKQRWHKNLRSDFGGKPGQWAYAESPLIDEEKLVCTPGGAQATMVALDKKTGEPIWKSAVPGGDEAGYASIIIVDAAGVKQYVQFLQKGLVGVDAASGKFLWRYAATAKGSPANIPTPVANDLYVYSASSMSGGGLVRLVATNGSIQAQQVYFAAKLPKAIGGTVLLGDWLYGTTDMILECVEFSTGQVKWSNRSIGAASVCYAEGMLYLHGENGEVALVQATSDGYHEAGRFSPPNQPNRGQAKAWAYPVIANARLYIRDLDMLWCYDIGK